MLLPYYSIGSNPDKIEAALSAEFSCHFTPHFVAEKGLRLPVILPENRSRIDLASWGFPHKKNRSEFILWTRCEGVLSKPVSRYEIRQQRCLIPANGFFIRKYLRTYFVFYPHRPVFAMAGIFRLIKQPEQECRLQFTILTVPANNGQERAVDRKPVTLGPSSAIKYLDIKRPLMDITQMLKHRSSQEIAIRETDPDILKSPIPDKREFFKHLRQIKSQKTFTDKEIFNNFYFHFTR